MPRPIPFHTDGETEAKNKEEFSPKACSWELGRAKTLHYLNSAHPDFHFHCAVILVARSLHARVTRAILNPLAESAQGPFVGFR